MLLSTSARCLIHGIMSRSLAPTCSIGCSASLARVALNEVWLTLFSSIQSRVKAAGLDVGQYALHLGRDLGRDDARAGDVFAVFGGVRHRIVHVGDAALVDQVDDQLHLVHALEIGHLGRVAGFDQRLVAGLHQLDQAAAQHGLLAEQVGLAFFLERGLDDAGATAADRRAIGQAEIVRVAGDVLWIATRHGTPAPR